MNDGEACFQFVWNIVDYQKTTRKKDETCVVEQIYRSIDDEFWKHVRDWVVISEKVLFSEIKEDQAEDGNGNDDGHEGCVEAGEPDSSDNVGVFDGELNLGALEDLVGFLLVVL